MFASGKCCACGMMYAFANDVCSAHCGKHYIIVSNAHYIIDCLAIYIIFRLAIYMSQATFLLA